MTISDEYKGLLRTLGDCPNVLLPAWEIPVEKSGNRKSQISVEAGRSLCSSHSAEQYPSQGLDFLLLALLLSLIPEEGPPGCGSPFVMVSLGPALSSHICLSNILRILMTPDVLQVIWETSYLSSVLQQMWVCCSKWGTDLATFPPVEVELTAKSPVGFPATTQREKIEMSE